VKNKEAKLGQLTIKTIKKQGQKLVQKFGIGRWCGHAKILYLFLQNALDLAQGCSCYLARPCQTLSLSYFHANFINMAWGWVQLHPNSAAWGYISNFSPFVQGVVLRFLVGF